MIVAVAVSMHAVTMAVSVSMTMTMLRACASTFATATNAHFDEVMGARMRALALTRRTKVILYTYT